MIFINIMLVLNTLLKHSHHWPLNVCALGVLSSTYVYCYDSQRDAYGTSLQWKTLKQRKKIKLKYILIWTSKESYTTSFLGKKLETFVQNNCPDTNCYVTQKRNLFLDDFCKFDAIIFDGRSLNPLDLPKKRCNRQVFIFMNDGPAPMYPVCNARFDNLFNWAFTYKLDSHIRFEFFEIRDKHDNIVGPSRKMKWKTDDNEVGNDVTSKWKNKNTAAAWISGSDCKSENNSESLAYKIRDKLEIANLDLDIYGDCGNRACGRTKTECWNMIQNKYYFYLSFEDVIAEDYVTEKATYPLEYYTIPIVYGGAKYSRFLPPKSYLDAKMPENLLVKQMYEIITTPELYKDYFSWRNVYKFNNVNKTKSICALCTALNNKTMVSRKQKMKAFRWWWLPSYRAVCKKV